MVGKRSRYDTIRVVLTPAGEVTRPAHQQRHSDGRLERHELLPPPVLAPHVAVVGREDHQGVGEHAAGLQQLHGGVELVVGGHDRAHLALAHRLSLGGGVVHRPDVGGLVGPIRLGHTGACADVRGGVLGLRHGELGRRTALGDVDPVRSLRRLVQQERLGRRRSEPA